MADDLNSVRQNTHFNRLTDIIPFVVCGVAETFFHSGIRVVEKAVGFRTIRMLYHLLCDDVVADIGKIEREWGWKPQITLETGIHQCVEEMK